MEELFKWGFNDTDIKDIISRNEELLNIKNEDINKLLGILIYIGCDKNIIRHIIISNPFYLNRMEDDVFKLIKKLLSIGIKDLDLLFESNPFVLNKDDIEIDEFINEKINKGMNMDEILEIIETDSFSEV